MKFKITDDNYSDNIVNFKTDYIVALWKTYNGKSINCPGWINELCKELYYFTSNGWSISLALKREDDVEPDKITKLVVLIQSSLIENSLDGILNYQSNPDRKKSSESEDEDKM